MSLRTKLLVVFAALAVLPLIALTVFDYTRSLNAVHRMIGDQTAPIAGRIARQVEQRLAIIDGDLRLLAGNSETLALFAAGARGDSAKTPFLDAAWRVLGPSYAWISFRDSTGVERRRLGQDAATGAQDTTGESRAALTEVITVPVRGGDRGRRSGTVVAAVRIDLLAPQTLMETRFGHGGYTVLADTGGRVVFDPLSPSFPHGAPVLLAFEMARYPADTAVTLRAIRFDERDSARVATVATIPASALVVISAGAIDEFAGSFARVRVANLTLALVLTTILIVAFVVVTRRATQPLETLTAAAGEVGRGNFTPSLPPSGDDEVGRLAAGFAAMSGHIERMMSELESSRQMAAVGSFARQIAHEIRNPLTSIKLNLQSLERDAREGLIPADRRRTVEICLEEIQRLDRVVRGVLTLGREATEPKRPACISSIVERALEVISPQLKQQGITLEYEPAPRGLAIEADETQLVGTFLNLFTNAAEAMPRGGTLGVAVESVQDHAASFARIVVSDTGKGVSAADRARIFDPFFSTKAEGSGIGLALALRDVEQHHGRILLLDGDGSEATGATFVVELPLNAAGAE